MLLLCSLTSCARKTVSNELFILAEPKEPLLARRKSRRHSHACYPAWRPTAPACAQVLAGISVSPDFQKHAPSQKPAPFPC
jgi:hypothetical protein